MADDSDACPICMIKYSEPQLLSTCGHTFCKNCILQVRTGVCPICRTKFQQKDIRPNYALAEMLRENRRPVGPRAAPEPMAEQAFMGMSGADWSQSQPRMGRTSSVMQKTAGLIALGAPFGLARLIGEEDGNVAVRIFLLDNSGSTQNLDGKFLVEAGNRTVTQHCSRWEEIKRMALSHAQWNIEANTPCEFMLLNPPSSRAFGAFREGVDFVSINPSSGNPKMQFVALQSMLNNTRPNGTTPLAERIKEIQHRLRSQYPHLATSGQKAIIVIATDGLPTTTTFGTGPAAMAEFVQALRILSSAQPVFLVVRLCTDDDSVVGYYNKIDEEEELPLEVIDDLESEAREIASVGNDWLLYTPLLHMIREGGTFVKLLDLLDERRLNPLEVKLLAGHLLQPEDGDMMPLSDPQAFAKQAEQRINRVPLAYDAIRQRMAPIIDSRKLRRAMQARVGFLRAGLRCLGNILPCA